MTEIGSGFKELIFDFYGVGVLISTVESQFQGVIHSLREDLDYFVVTNNEEVARNNVRINMQLKAGHHGSFPKTFGFPVFKTKMCRVYGLGRERTCDYGNGTIICSQRKGKNRSFLVTGSVDRSDEVYEVTYLALLSAVGEELDLLGFHRIHALGFSLRGRSSLILLPSGGGKSTMAAVLMKKSDFSIFSDEMPLVKDGVIYPFPTRIALFPPVADLLKIDSNPLRLFKRKVYPAKVLVSVEKRRVSNPEQLYFLFGGKVGFQSPRIFESGGIRLPFQLLGGFVVGLGLCQMAEHMLRVDNIFRLIRIGCSRLVGAISLYLRAKKGIFEVSLDPYENIVELEFYFQKCNSTRFSDALSEVEEIN